MVMLRKSSSQFLGREDDPNDLTPLSVRQLSSSSFRQSCPKYFTESAQDVLQAPCRPTRPRCHSYTLQSESHPCTSLAIRPATIPHPATSQQRNNARPPPLPLPHPRAPSPRRAAPTATRDNNLSNLLPRPKHRRSLRIHFLHYFHPARTQNPHLRRHPILPFLPLFLLSQEIPPKTPPHRRPRTRRARPHRPHPHRGERAHHVEPGRAVPARAGV